MVFTGKRIRRVQIRAVTAFLLSTALFAFGARQDPENTPKSATSTAHKPASSVQKKPSSSAGANQASTKTSPAKTSRKRSRKRTSRVRGQQKIDSDRVRAIQEALIREHYLAGEPTGTWNQASEDAMRKYQADHGWQSKTVPDSRALISLGLGPSKDHLLNPESAMTTVPDPPKAQTGAPASHTAPATADHVSPSSSAPAATSTPPTSQTDSPQ